MGSWNHARHALDMHLAEDEKTPLGEDLMAKLNAALGPLSPNQLRAAALDLLARAQGLKLRGLANSHPLVLQLAQMIAAQVLKLGQDQDTPFERGGTAQALFPERLLHHTPREGAVSLLTLRCTT